MATFEAHQSADTSDLAELYLMTDGTSSVTFTTTEITFTEGTTVLKLKGHFTNASTGTVSSIEADDNGTKAWTLTGLSITVTNLHTQVDYNNASRYLLQGGDTITGSGKPDFLYGYSGDDVISGGSGNDTLSGSKGNDTLTGGSGHDLFLFNTALDASTNVDTLTDFNASQDHIGLAYNIFTNVSGYGDLETKEFFVVGSGTETTSDRIIYNATNGNLSYDPDGSGSASAVLFAKLSTHPTLTHADFLII